MPPRRRTSAVWAVRLRLRFEDAPGAVPAALLPAGWSTSEDPAARGPDAWRDLGAGGVYSASAVVMPSLVTIERTPHRQPSTCTVEIPWAVLPLDPRVIRALGVEVFAAAVTPDELSDSTRTGRLPFDLTRETLRFMGTARPVNSEPRRKVTISASDFTHLAVEAKPGPAALRALDLDGTVVTVAQQVLDACPATRGMRVVWSGDGTPPPVVSLEAASDGTVKLGRVPYNPQEPETTAWDVVTDISTRCGCVAWIDLDTVRIATARTVFAGGAVRRFVDAVSISRLVFSRDLGRRNIPAVEVRAWSAQRGLVLRDRFPADAPVSTEDVIQTVSGVETVAGLAEALYYELRRQRMDGMFETASISPIGADDGALLALTPGDVIDVAPPLVAFEAGDLRELPQATARQRLIDAGIRPAVADAITAALYSGRLTTYWTREARFRWAPGSGTEIGVSFAELPTLLSQPRGRLIVTAG